MYRVPVDDVKLDGKGNVYHLVAHAEAKDEYTAVFTYSLSKYQPDGNQLWSITLPVIGEFESSILYIQPLALDANGSAAVGFAHVVAKVSPDGRLEWMSTNSPATSVCLSDKGTLCAASFDQGYKIFSKKGKLLEQNDNQVGGYVLPVPQGRFLLQQESVFVGTKPAGSERWGTIWRTLGGSYPPSNVVGDGAGGWMSVGAIRSDMVIARMDSQGQETWSKTFEGISSDRHPSPYVRTLLRGKDGKIRFIQDVGVFWSQSEGYRIYCFAPD
jgi:hypothetical protein